MTDHTVKNSYSRTVRRIERLPWIEHELLVLRSANRTDGVFPPSAYPLDSLDAALGRSDFAIVIAAGDDVITSRKKRHRAPRDNVTFELGLAIGRLSRKRTLLLEPRTAPVKLASDLLGLTTIPYSWDSAADPIAQMAVATSIIRKTVLDLGPS